MPQKLKKRHLLDYGILIPYLILCVFGLVMVYSSTSYVLLEQSVNPMKSVINQLVFWILSLIIISVMYKMRTSVFRNDKLAYLAMIVVIGLLIFVFAFGKEINGAKGWIAVGPITVQPAEFFKIISIWYLSLKLSNRQRGIQQEGLEREALGPMIPVIIGLGFIALMPDFGNATVITLCVLTVLLASGVNYLYTITVGLGGTLAAWLFIKLVTVTGGGFLPAHVASRFLVFQDPFKDQYDKGHQMVNGYYAIFNGGLFGRGLGNSVQKKGFLKFAHTDYIFAIVMEELGLIFSLVVLALLFFMIARIFLVGIRATDPFNSMMCIGIGSLFMFQVFVNLGGITGIIPLTGITFPFLSQGGSSLLMLSICIAFVLNISAEEKRKKYGIPSKSKRG